jgi:hypothetical protein
MAASPEQRGSSPTLSLHVQGTCNALPVTIPDPRLIIPPGLLAHPIPVIYFLSSWASLALGLGGENELGKTQQTECTTKVIKFSRIMLLSNSH